MTTLPYYKWLYAPLSCFTFIIELNYLQLITCFLPYYLPPSSTKKFYESMNFYSAHCCMIHMLNSCVGHLVWEWTAENLFLKNCFLNLGTYFEVWFHRKILNQYHWDRIYTQKTMPNLNVQQNEFWQRKIPMQPLSQLRYRTFPLSQNVSS